MNHHSQMKKTPEYIINPVANYSPVWLPEVYQLCLGSGNIHYFNSLWLGTVWNLLSLPMRLILSVGVPLFNFRFLTVFANLFVVLLSVVVFLFAGVFGILVSLPVTREQAKNGIVLDHEQGLECLAAGNLEFVTHIDDIRQ
jgi:hypothetical protein